MTKVNLFINGREYFPVKNTSLGHSINRSIAIKSATLNCIAGFNFKDFLLELNLKKILLCELYIDDKIFLEGFINDKLVHYQDSPSGTEVNIRLLDRFVGLIGSDLIASRPQGTLQSFLSDILTELGYVSPVFINTYRKNIKNPRDFLASQGVDISKPLRALQRSSLVEESSQDLLGECLNINNVILLSNGYDTLTFEKPNTKGSPVFSAFRYFSDKRESNLVSVEKYGEMGDANSLTPSIVITLNSYAKQAKKDSNTSVISSNPYGIPHIIRLHRTSMQASYQDIQGMMDFSFAGIKARSNSFILRFCNIKFDDNLDFFQPNRTINVYDEKYGLDTDMIIMNSELNIDASGGSELTLNVTFKESFEDNISIKQKGRILK
jgi:hypothetical protein